jgi:hypothetical protein
MSFIYNIDGIGFEYMPLSYTSDFWCVNALFYTRAEIQILILSENVTNNVTFWSKLLYKILAILNNHFTFFSKISKYIELRFSLKTTQEMTSIFLSLIPSQNKNLYRP